MLLIIAIIAILTPVLTYTPKESLREIWRQISKEEAEKVLIAWVEQARSSGQKQLMKMAEQYWLIDEGSLLGMTDTFPRLR